MATVLCRCHAMVGNEQSNPSFRRGDFIQEFGGSLWLNNWCKFVQADLQTLVMDAGMGTTSEMGLISVQGQGASVAIAGRREASMSQRMCDEDGRISDAVNTLDLLVQQGRHVPNYQYYRVLKGCIQIKDLALGRRIHSLAVKSGYEGDSFLATHLIGLYASHGRLDEAKTVFAKVVKPDAYNLSAIIFACARHGEATEAIRLYRQTCNSSTTVKPANRIYSAVLKACAVAGDLGAGKKVHSMILSSSEEPDRFVQAGLVDMYAKCGSLDDARGLFDELPVKDAVIWTTMIAAYAQQGMGQEALILYRSMQQEGLTRCNAVTYACLLQACASVGVTALDQGKQVHAEIRKQGLQKDVVLEGSLINMYAKCGSLTDARMLFETLSERDVVTWTALIAGYAEQGNGQEALLLHRRMQQEGLRPNAATYICLLQACASLDAGALAQGKQLHAQITVQGLQTDLVLASSLVNMYVKCGSLDDARMLFDKLPERSVVTWTTMIAGYAQQGMCQQALILYGCMLQDGLTPNSFTYVCLLQACAEVAALPLGELLHAEIRERGMHANGIVGSALVNMYAKCGCMSDAQRVFDSLLERSSEAWGALIGGYALQGESQVVFDLLDRMSCDGVQANEITFLSVLTVCSHVGLVDQGLQYFQAMGTRYGVTATMEHYICMVDLLGRAGHLHQALQMAKTMPFPASDAVWHTLLNACRKWKNVEIGQQVFDAAVSMDGNDAASHALISDIYASTHMWEADREMKAKRRKLGTWKKPGQSWWTDMGGVVHTFLVADKKHSDNERINHADWNGR